MVAALALAAVSAGFSITGMAAVFVGATLPVIGMGAALDTRQTVRGGLAWSLRGLAGASGPR
jgi:hypothetical protein